MSPSIILIAIVLVVIIIVYLQMKDRAKVTKQPKRTPRGTMADVVRPGDKDKMLPNRQYCSVSFDANVMKTIVTYYDRDSQREKKVDDPTSLRASEIRESLYQAGWSWVAGRGHQEGNENFFDHVKQPNVPL